MSGQKVYLKRLAFNQEISMVGMVPGVFFIWGSDEILFRKIHSTAIEGGDDDKRPNCMRMSDGELIHLPFSSLVEVCEKVEIKYQ